jgi:hypothetical protein
VWAGAEAQLAEKAGEYTPRELQVWGTALVELLDQDGADPDEREPEPVNELHLTPNANGIGGKITGRFDSAALYGAIAAAVDAWPSVTTSRTGSTAGRPSSTTS